MSGSDKSRNVSMGTSRLRSFSSRIVGATRVTLSTWTLPWSSGMKATRTFSASGVSRATSRERRTATRSATRSTSSRLCVDSSTVFSLVDEEKRAWQAGRSWWQGHEDLNSRSIGVEIVNGGHDYGLPPFPDLQIDVVIDLCKGILSRWPIPQTRIVAHSDIAPDRKEDPGELFPWSAFAKRRLALPSPTRDLMDPFWTDAGFLLALERFGYDVSDSWKAVIAFQRRFRPDLIDGIIDGECRAKLLSLLLPRPQ